MDESLRQAKACESDRPRQLVNVFAINSAKGNVERNLLMLAHRSATDRNIMQDTAMRRVKYNGLGEPISKLLHHIHSSFIQVNLAAMVAANLPR